MNLRSGAGLTALMTLPGIGEKRALALAERFHTWGTLATATDKEIIACVGRAAGTGLIEDRPADLTPPPLPAGVRVISILDEDYPSRLRTIPHPPTLLWVLGTLPPPDAPALAVVGTRHPTEYGQSVARLAATGAAEQGIAVISGLAKGCDTIAHEAALDAHGGTWAIVGCGIDMLNSGSRALADRIVASDGGVLAEVPPGTRTMIHLLTQRNRLQSGLSEGTLIAQSGVPGEGRPAGTMHTARFAIEQDRLLIVGRPTGRWAEGEESAGNLALTDPTGCDPAVIYATKPTLVAKVQARQPVADIVLTGRADLPDMWTRLAEAATRPPSTAPEPPVEELTLPWQ